eukprot:TRINITY_DN6519_c0_g1_i1.p1 TRINITY_DN6519_c0_g1~~TRINITY_DN6519_c0_g1_i1.p1  ORF type:complete len:941 (+),score=136.12 TRINITY_DN6519_c0_g1_i1:20-2842(+)
MLRSGLGRLGEELKRQQRRKRLVPSSSCCSPSSLILYSTESTKRPRRTTRSSQRDNASTSTSESESNGPKGKTAKARGGSALSNLASDAAEDIENEASIPSEIQMLLDLKRTIPGLTVVVTESAPTAFEIARVLNVKNKGALNQGWVGDVVSVLDAATSDSPSSRSKKVIVTWTLGQMFSIVGDDLKQRRWAARGVVPAALSELPWLPSKLHVAARPGANNERQIKILQALLTSASEVVSAVEPDAEGELLFRDLLSYLGIASRSFKRAWLRSRTDSDVIEAFSNLMDGHMLDPLAAYAASSRAADHITGVNYSALVSGTASPRPELVVTRDGSSAVRGLGRTFLAQAPADAAPTTEDASTEAAPSHETSEDQLPTPEDPVQESQATGAAVVEAEEEPDPLTTKPVMRKASPLGYQESIYNVGRIQTPVLRLIVERFIQNYQATRTKKMEPTYTIMLLSSMRDRSENLLTIPWVWCGREPDINRTWSPPQWSSFLSGSAVSHASSEEVSEIANSLSDELRVVHESNRNVVLPAPRLFNLASLQVEASKKLGLTPHSTLVIAMQLFDARVISFPKTTCETMPPHLSSEYLNTVLVWSKASRYRIFADVVSPRARISASRRDPRIFRESSFLEHHAIVPVLPSQKADAKVIDAYLSKLNDAQKRLLDLIVSRLFESCMPDSECQEVDLVATSNNVHYFSTRVSFAIRDGWQRIQSIAAETLMAPRKGRQRQQTVPLSSEVAEKVSALLDSGSSRSYNFLASPPFVSLGDSVSVLPPSAFSRVIEISSKENKYSRLFSDAEIVRMMSDPTPDVPSGAAIGDVATRSAALQQLIHWKYVTHKNGHYVPTRRGIRLAKLVSDEPISFFTHLTQQESQLRLAAAAMEPEVAMDSLKREIKESVGPIASRGHIFMPYDIDSFHGSQGTGTFELKIVRSETCPKCRNA